MSTIGTQNSTMLSHLSLRHSETMLSHLGFASSECKDDAHAQEVSNE